VYQDRLIKDI